MKKQISKLNGSEKIYQMITDKILDKLDAGIVPWHKPWKTIPGQGGMPANLVSKKCYRGINILLLGMEGYSSCWWVTYKQAAKLGGNVRKGEKGTTVIFWKFLDKEDKETKEIKTIPMIRYYTVFNVEQCDGLEEKIPGHKEAKEAQEAEEVIEPIDACEAIWKGYSFRPVVKHGGNRAAYSPIEDRIMMPNKKQFDSQEKYYGVLFHEGVHSTGHSKRLNRDELVTGFFSKKKYGKEELVAEFGACFLCGVAGIDPHVIDNSAAYIANWKKQIKGDRKLVVQAAARAQKAADWVLDPDTHFKE